MNLLAAEVDMHSIIKELLDSNERFIFQGGSDFAKEIANELSQAKHWQKECQVLAKKVEEQDKEMQKLTIRLIIELEKCEELRSNVKQLEKMISTACEAL
jgi:predicted RNase H-like nuclease (RuvC/YqgF family)